MPTRKSTKNSIKNYLNNFDSYEQLPSKLDDILLGSVEVKATRNTTKNYFIF